MMNQTCAQPVDPQVSKPPTFREQIAAFRKSAAEEMEKMNRFEARVKDLGILDKPCNYLQIWDLSDD